MERVTGIGGVFFKSKDPEALRNWYRDHLGIKMEEFGAALFQWGGAGSESGLTVWSPFAQDSKHC